MQLLYIDESGTPDIPGNTSHYILAGISIPIWKWKTCDRTISAIKKKYGLGNHELHVAWILRSYREQRLVKDFDLLDAAQRRSQVQSLRTANLLRLQKIGNHKQYKLTRKTYRITEPYTHLNYAQRTALIKEVAEVVASWGFARLFGEGINKIHFDPSRATSPVDEQAFEQVVSRFERYLQAIAKLGNPWMRGMLIHDNNDTVARKHTELMMRFHTKGTLWTSVHRIIETPLFVNSQLTSMVQIADLWGYALRRYFENGEDMLFDILFVRADRKGSTVVGVRHYSDLNCACKVCIAHRRTPPAPAVAP
jgi:hypothetical protein